MPIDTGGIITMDGNEPADQLPEQMQRMAQSIDTRLNGDVNAGIQIRAGGWSTGASGAVAVAIFPSFPTACDAVIVQLMYPTGNITLAVDDPPSAAAFTVRSYTTGTNTPRNDVPFRWVAIGR